MHSSRIRTVRYRLPGGCLPKDVSAWGGVCLRGVSAWGGVCLGRVCLRGCLPEGVGCLREGGVSLGGVHLPVNRILDTHL